MSSNRRSLFGMSALITAMTLVGCYRDGRPGGLPPHPAHDHVRSEALEELPAPSRATKDTRPPHMSISKPVAMGRHEGTETGAVVVIIISGNVAAVQHQAEQGVQTIRIKTGAEQWTQGQRPRLPPQVKSTDKVKPLPRAPQEAAVEAPWFTNFPDCTGCYCPSCTQ